YSHTPKGQGAKQPGMSGMVKEEVITRQQELGFSIADGKLSFDLLLLDRKEFLEKASTFNYWNIDGLQEQVELPPGSIVNTICQVPIIFQESNQATITIHFKDGKTQQIQGHELDSVASSHLFMRDGVIHHLLVFVESNK
ncbi:MAG: hypothetical protein HGA28_08040, partial [Anaerolineaceae bacterium]|nr:hypothetical protein [Anaerolineaceae bacterium]